MNGPFQNFFQKLTRHGMEYFGLFYASYRGTVADNEDPEMLGRVKIRCAAIYGNDTPSYWAWPKVPFAGNQIGFFAIPEIDDGVYIECEGGNPKYPIWSGGWWAKPGAQSEVPEAARISPPTNRLWQTKSGHKIELDDSSGVEKIKITDKSGNYILIDSTSKNEEHLVGGKKIDKVTADKEETVGGKKSSNIALNKDEIIGGKKTCNITLNKEETIGANKISNITVNKQEIVGGSWTITATGGIIITGSSVAIISGSGTANIGGGKSVFDNPEFEVKGGSVKLASQGATFKLVIDTFLALFDGHTHRDVQSGASNSGVPNQLAGAGHRTINTEAS